MADPKDIIRKLNSNQKSIIKKAAQPGNTILFNIKGMIQILRNQEPFEFIEMGYDDVEKLNRMGVLSPLRTHEQSHVLQGEEYGLSELGKTIAETLK